MSETRICPQCEKERSIVEDFYSEGRSHCKECERVSASSRMRRYGKTLRGKASQALQSSRKTIKNNGYEVVDDLTLMDVIFTFALAEGECAYCGKVSDEYSLEHIIPLQKGGANTLSNITVACKPCNSSKHNRDLLTWKVSEEIALVIEKIASRRGVTPLAVLEDLIP